MIENAEHTIDFAYYIFKTDMVGHAMLGAMCNAVKRGVDIRVIVDAAGSLSGLAQQGLKALETCADDAGFMRSSEGERTNKKARVQVVVFNAITKLGNPNRRSHDKLLVKDGSFESKSVVLTGGRNISEDYYGIRGDGSIDPEAFRDAEILLRSHDQSLEEDITVGEVSEGYATILFLLDFNKRIRPGSSPNNADQYARERQRAQDQLARLKSFDYFRPYYEAVDVFMSEGFHVSEVRLAHELGNLTDKSVVSEADRNQQANPNSIMETLRRIGEEAPQLRSLRIASPYMFLAEYRDRDGNPVMDEAQAFREWLDQHPEHSLELVTNSVLTSDNFPAQSIIDMETAPRLLLPPDLRQEWLELDGSEELSAALVNSETWAELINHPRLRVYEVGRLDSVLLGGTKNYGKLHAKFLVAEDVGFIGTTNFDYRSRLYNNEMGFFFHDPGLAADVHASFDELIENAYLWGSPEWLQLRKAVMDKGGMKGRSTKRQRSWYKFFKKSGIIWLL
jgi:phosphatidylserine/phosphatidylglycerophosphate/cardiolipin synthase-like enzyme